jgi:small subunit ribosomal protein S20
LLIQQGDLEAAELMSRKAASTLDKAARKGIVHKRNASRRKSRLMKELSLAQKTKT